MDKNELERFVKYVGQFYCPGEIYAHYFKEPVSLDDIREATIVLGRFTKLCFDTVDRERVRDLMLYKRGQV